MKKLSAMVFSAGLLSAVNTMSQTAATDGGERFNSIGSGEAQLKQRIRMDGGSKQKEMVTLGGGCFWCTEAIFEQLKGVEKVESGYSGGSSANPTYKEVCSGTTGHAEVVEITFDPKVISLKDLLRVFFLTHDPTTLNRQGDDVGTQYRSVIFYRDEAQKQAAQEVIQQIRDEKIWDGPIVTELAPFKAFYKAEDYHQGYFRKNPQQGYCRAVIAPKVAKVREKFRDKLKDK